MNRDKILRQKLFIYVVIILCGATGLSLSGCNQTRMSVDKAEQVILNYQGENFTPPPRGIETYIEKIELAGSGEVQEHICQMCPSMDVNDPNPLIRMQNLSKLAIVTHLRGNSAQSMEYIQKAYKLLNHESIKKRYYGQMRNDFDHEYFSVMHRAAKIHLEAGRFMDAIGFMEEAKKLNEDKDKPRRGKALNQNAFLAAAYAQVGDIERAEDALAEGESHYDAMKFQNERAQKMALYLKQVSAVVNGNISDARGELRLAEDQYREAIGFHNKHVEGRKGSTWARKAIIMGSYLVDNLLAQGRVAEAEAQLITATDFVLAKFGAESYHMGKLLQSYIKVLMAQQRYDDAKKLYKKAKNIYRKMGADPYSFELAKLNLLLADIYVAKNNWPAAHTQYLKVYKDLRSDPTARKGLFSNNPGWVISLGYNKDYRAALQAVDQLVKINSDSYGDQHKNTIEAYGIKAMLLASTGKAQQAQTLYEKILPKLVNQENKNYLQRFDSGVNNQRLRLIIEPYLSVLANRANNGDSVSAEKAFYIVQLIQNKDVQNAVAASAARASIKQPEMVGLIRREQDTLRKIEAAYNHLSKIQSDSGQTTKQLHGEIKTRIDKLVEAHQSLLTEIRNRYPEYDELVRPSPVSYADARKLLKADEALILTYSGMENFYTWTVTAKGGIGLIRSMLSAKELSAMTLKLRKGLDLQAASIKEIPVFDVKTSNKLYQKVFKPSEHYWKQARQLVVISDGALGALPLSVLVTSKPAGSVKHGGKYYFDGYKKINWLANTHAISYSPSVTALKSLRKNQVAQGKVKRFLGFGDPVFRRGQTDAALAQLNSRGINLSMRSLRRIKHGVRNQEESLDASVTPSIDLSMLMALPETAAEIKNIARVLNVDEQNNVFLGRAANEAQVKSMPLNDRKIIMFATHALLPGDVDGLTQPAIALSVPEAKNNQNDGLLTMSEIMGLQLNADWVVLSACNTGAGSGRGAGAISGLGQAFFYAGSRSLLVSHWAVETSSAAQLTTKLFENLIKDKQLSRSQAMAQTMREVMQQGVYKDDLGKTIFSYAHPIFWAPFTVVGDGSGKL